MAAIMLHDRINEELMRDEAKHLQHEVVSSCAGGMERLMHSTNTNPAFRTARTLTITWLSVTLSALVNGLNVALTTLGNGLNVALTTTVPGDPPCAWKQGGSKLKVALFDPPQTRNSKKKTESGLWPPPSSLLKRGACQSDN